MSPPDVGVRQIAEQVGDLLREAGAVGALRPLGEFIGREAAFVERGSQDGDRSLALAVGGALAARAVSTCRRFAIEVGDKLLELCVRGSAVRAFDSLLELGGTESPLLVGACQDSNRLLAVAVCGAVVGLRRRGAAEQVSRRRLSLACRSSSRRSS